MAQTEVHLTALFDAATNTLTLRVELPIPAPPAGFTENDGWWTRDAQTAEVSIGLKRNSITTNTSATYFVLDPTAPGGHQTWNVTYSGTAWNMPGTRVS